MSKVFAALFIMLSSYIIILIIRHAELLHNYFNSLIKLISDLAKFLDTSAKPFLSCSLADLIRLSIIIADENILWNF